MRSQSVLGLLVVLLMWFPTAQASDLTAVWTGNGDGSSYSDAQNWDIQVLPCNVDTVSFNVDIPGGGFTVDADVAECEISSLNVGDSSRLRLTTNASLTVLGASGISGILEADNSTFIGNPFHLLGDKARAYAGNGAYVATGSGDPLNEDGYSSLGLWASGSFSNTRYWDLFKSEGQSTLLDLSSIRSIDAGFNDHDGNDKNIQRIRALNGGTIDLSNLETITAPAGLYDRIHVFTEKESEIIFSSLETLDSAGRGYSYIEANDNATLYMPSLTNASQVMFSVLTGSKISVDDPENNLTPSPLSYSSLGLWASATWGHNRYWDLLKAEGPSTLLDLSSIRSIDAGFNDHDGDDKNIQRIRALDGGTIDLSGLETLTPPVRNEDRIDCLVDGGSLILGTVSEYGPPFIDVRGVDSNASTALLEVRGNVTLLEPNELHLSEATLSVGGDLVYNVTDEADFKAADILNLDTINSLVHMNGNGTQFLEIGGLNVDTYTAILQNDNFGFGKMIVGEPDQPTTVSLQDEHFNGNGCKSEALYLFGLSDIDPNGLVIHEGSSLVLNGINVYALRSGVMEHLNSLFGDLDEVEYAGGGTIKRGIPVCEGDFDLDGDVDGSDLAAFAADFGKTDCTQESSCEGDFCSDGDVDGTDLSIFAADFGRTDCPKSR